LKEVDRVITTLDRRYPDILLKNARAPELKHTDYALGDGSLDIVRLYQLFNQGSTITLAFLDTVVPSLTMLCRSLESEFSCPFQTNVYMTPPGAQGAEPHYDTHDVFVLQVNGTKHWTIFGTPVESPLPDQSFDAKLHELGDRTLEFELEPGDVAFIPAGVAHEAQSTDTVSLHITVGVLRYTWADLLTRLIVAESSKNAALRKSLPPGFARSDFDRTQPKQAVRHLLHHTSFESSFDDILDNFIERLFARCPPVLEGQMEQLALVDSLNLDSLVGARQGVLSRMTTDAATLSIDTYGRTITLPAHAQDSVRFALNQARFFVKDLPGNLDDAGKLTVVRRLIGEGLMMAFPA
jgi:ribosomal protein L16 Arg81 hydroxylase